MSFKPVGKMEEGTATDFEKLEKSLKWLQKFIDTHNAALDSGGVMTPKFYAMFAAAAVDVEGVIDEWPTRVFGAPVHDAPKVPQ